MHLKRKTIPKFWPIPKTGNKYLVTPSHEQYNSVPLLIVLRDIMRIAKTRKELNKLLNEKKVEVNRKIVQEKAYPIALFDTLSLPSIGKHYRAVLSNKKISFKEISEKEAGTRIYKLINKTVLPNKKVQLNFGLGRNVISSEKIKMGDFAVFDIAKNKILKIIPLEKETSVTVIGGKHIGKSGKIKELVNEGGNLIARISIDSGEKGELKTHIKNLFVIE